MFVKVSCDAGAKECESCGLHREEGKTAGNLSPRRNQLVGGGALVSDSKKYNINNIFQKLCAPELVIT